jgi:hypothetical protein
LALHEFSAPVFADAAGDYFYLINRAYPEKSALKLVGDRYRLSGNQRNCLYRGITSQAIADTRMLKRTENLKHQLIHVDAYNVLFTIMNYLLGKRLFISNDGFLRDSGEAYGKIENREIFFRSINLLLDCLSAIHPEHSLFHLDTSVDSSRQYRDIMENGLKARHLSGEVLLSKHADTDLLKVKDGIIATSDSEIIDHGSVGIIDLARPCLESNFQTTFVGMEELLQ